MKDWTTVLRRETQIELEQNWIEQQPLKGTRQERDFNPVCKLFLPWTSGTWLLTEKEPGSSLCFGLCDLGMGCPELGYVDLEEIHDVQGPGGLRVEQDIHWRADKPLSAYAAQATAQGYIQA